MSKLITDRLEKLTVHKTFILTERVYLAIIDKIYNAEHYDNFEVDSDNNIFVTYSLKKDESILDDIHDLISEQIKKKYRKKLESKLEEEGYFVEYDDSEIHVYFEEPLKIDNNSLSNSSEDSNYYNNVNNETNILKYKKPEEKVIIAEIADLTNIEVKSEIFNFGEEDDK